jgi:glycosyltransferase involved in cell wall biosynthesis
MPAAVGLRVLHISSDFAKQRVYPELVRQLDQLGVEQHVYVPVRSSAELGVNRQADLARVTYRYSHILRPRHRLLFRTKIRRVARDVLEGIDPRSFTAVHAHFLYSDGAVALALRKRFGVPYLAAVRNTDVNVFMRLRPDLRFVCWDVVAQAENLVFISPAYLDLLRRRVPASLRPALEAKAKIVPNGVAQFWLDRSADTPAPPRSDGALKLLYVGELAHNKNIVAAIRATARCNERRPTTLTLVGGGGDAERQIDSLLKSGQYPFVTRRGRVDDPVELRSIYRAHDIFVMPSFRETFGVAYVEALSQGLPIVFSRGQGVDGYFEPGTVGEAVNPHDVRDVERGVAALALRLDAVRERCRVAAQSFAWPLVAQSYVGLYRAISAKNGGASAR